jgi:hypothetical protein
MFLSQLVTGACASVHLRFLCYLEGLEISAPSGGGACAWEP